MGNYLQTLKNLVDSQQHTISLQQFFTTTQLRQFYSAFQSICDTPIITMSEFDIIFQDISDQSNSFGIWDPEGAGLVDALELFTGLALVSKDNEEEKLQFIFDLFDLNHQHQLTKMELVILLQTCCTVVPKLLSLWKNEQIQQIIKFLEADNEIQQLLDINLLSISSINIVQFLNCVKRVKESQLFFNLIMQAFAGVADPDHNFSGRQQLPSNLGANTDREQKQQMEGIKGNQGYNKEGVGPEQQLPNQIVQPNLDNKQVGKVQEKPQLSQIKLPLEIPFLKINEHLVKQLDSQFQPSRPIEYLLNNKKQMQKQQWISQNHQRLHHQDVQYTNSFMSDNQCSVSWVYGMRCQDALKPVIYLDKEDKLIYFSGNIVIIYNCGNNTQNHYLQHQNPVISVAVGTCGSKIAASGELCEFPSLHLWNVGTQKNIGVISGILRKGIPLLQFFHKDSLIALTSVAFNERFSVYVYSVDNLSLLLSQQVEGSTPLDLLMISNLIGQQIEDSDIITFEAYIDRVQQTEPIQLQEDMSSPILKPAVKQLDFKLIEPSQIARQCNSSLIITTPKQLYILSLAPTATNYSFYQINFEGEDCQLLCATSYIVNSSNYLIKTVTKIIPDVVVILSLTNGDLRKWVNFQSSVLIANYREPVTHLIVAESCVVAATAASLVYIWDLNFEKQFFQLDLSKVDFKMLSPRINYVLLQKSQVLNFTQINLVLLVITEKGDVFQATICWSINQQGKRRVIIRKNLALNSIYQSIYSIALSSTQAQDGGGILYVAGSESTVLGYSLSDHQLIDIWDVGGMECITCLDSVILDEQQEGFYGSGNSGGGGSSLAATKQNSTLSSSFQQIINRSNKLIFAVGCRSGKIFIRANWAIDFHQGSSYQFKSTSSIYEESEQQQRGIISVTDIKLSKSGEFLAASCFNGQVIIFKRAVQASSGGHKSDETHSYFKGQQKLFIIEGEVPLSLTFLEEDDSSQYQQQSIDRTMQNSSGMTSNNSVVQDLGNSQQQTFSEDVIKRDISEPYFSATATNQVKVNFLLVATQQNNCYMLSIKDQKVINTQQLIKKIKCSDLPIFYPTISGFTSAGGGVGGQNNNKNGFQPLHQPKQSTVSIIGSDSRLILSSGDYGQIFFWRNMEQLMLNNGGLLNAHGNCSQISKLLISPNQDTFFSAGFSDHTVVEWKINFINESDNFMIPSQETSFLLPNQNSSNNAQSNIGNLDQKYAVKDLIIARELAFCRVRSPFFNNSEDLQYQQMHQQWQQYREAQGASFCSIVDSLAWFRGTNQRNFNQYLSQTVEGFNEVDGFAKRPPNASLSIDYVFGVASFEIRNSINYVQVYEGLNSGGGLEQQEQQQHKLQCYPTGASTALIAVGQRSYPQRRIAYFSSRLGIVFNPKNSSQKFYEGHKQKINCMAVHPSRCIVATGENSLNPQIHVWSVSTLEPLAIIRTYHEDGIISLAFTQSEDSSSPPLIASVSVDRFYSVQISNWKSREIIAVRNSGPHPIFQVVFDPIDAFQFTTCSCQHLTVWQINGRDLMRRFHHSIQELNQTSQSSCITCFTYIQCHIKSNSTQYSDLLLGNQQGDFYLITHNTLILVREKAHQKMINCIKVIKNAFFSQTRQQQTFTNFLIISSAQDEFIRIWDCSFNLLNEIQIAKKKIYQHLPQAKSTQESKDLSASSIDLFTYELDCQRNGGGVGTQRGSGSAGGEEDIGSIPGILDTDIESSSQDLVNKKKQKIAKKMDSFIDVQMLSGLEDVQLQTYLNQKLKSIKWPTMLIGTRYGDIMEAQFSVDIRDLLMSGRLSQKEDQQMQQQIQSPMTLPSPRRKGLFSSKHQQQSPMNAASPRKKGNKPPQQQQQSFASALSFQNSSQEGEDDGEDFLGEFQRLPQCDAIKFISIVISHLEKFTFDIKLLARFHASKSLAAAKQSPNNDIITRKVLFSLHPVHPILATVGEDQTLCFFDTQTNQLVQILYLGQATTSIKFSPDGNVLAIGFFTGEVLIFDWKYECNNSNNGNNATSSSGGGGVGGGGGVSINKNQSQGVGKIATGGAGDKPQQSATIAGSQAATAGSGEESKLIQYNTSLRDPDFPNPVINLEFSPSSTLLAVSFGVTQSMKEHEGNDSNVSSFIRIFSCIVSRTVDQKRSFVRKTDIQSQNYYDQSRNIYATNQAASFSSAVASNIASLGQGGYFSSYIPTVLVQQQLDLNHIFLGVYFMTFSESSEHLLLYYQYFDDLTLSRFQGEKNGFFKVFDIQKNQMMKAWEQQYQQQQQQPPQKQQQKIIWSRLNFPHSLLGRFSMSDFNTINVERQKIPGHQQEWQKQIKKQFTASSNYNQVAEFNEINVCAMHDIRYEDFFQDLIGAEDAMPQLIYSFLVLGSVQGNLYITTSKSLYLEQDKGDVSKLPLQYLCQAKTYAAHTAPIYQCEVSLTASQQSQNSNNQDKSDQKQPQPSQQQQQSTQSPNTLQIQRTFSSASQIEGFQPFLFTTCAYNETLIKWKINILNQSQEIDTIIKVKNQRSVIAQFLESQGTSKAALTLRSNLLSQAVGLSSNTKSLVPKLSIRFIIGRTAFNKLDTAQYDINENVLFISGCNLIIAFRRPKMVCYTGQSLPLQLKSETIFSYQEVFQGFADSSEIQAFRMSMDGRFVAVASQDFCVKLSLWEFGSRTALKSMILGSCQSVILIKFPSCLPEQLDQSGTSGGCPNSNNCFSLTLCCLALSHQQSTVILLIDIMQGIVLGSVNLQFSSQYKILDMEFLPQSVTRFVTCGHQHLALWSLKGGVLSYTNFEIMTPILLKKLIWEQEEKETALKRQQKNAKQQLKQPRTPQSEESNTGNGNANTNKEKAEKDQKVEEDQANKKNEIVIINENGQNNDNDSDQDEEEEEDDDDEREKEHEQRGQDDMKEEEAEEYNLKQQLLDIQLLFCRLVLIERQSIMITGGEDGFLYLWQNFKIRKRFLAYSPRLSSNIYTNKSTGPTIHPAVTSMAVKANTIDDSSYLVAAGNEEGGISIWLLQFLNSTKKNRPPFTFKRMQQCSLMQFVTESYKSLECTSKQLFVQSISFGKLQQLLIGTRNGCLFEIQFNVTISTPSAATSNQPLILQQQQTPAQQLQPKKPNKIPNLKNLISHMSSEQKTPIKNVQAEGLPSPQKSSTNGAGIAISSNKDLVLQLIKTHLRFMAQDMSSPFQADFSMSQQEIITIDEQGCMIFREFESMAINNIINFQKSVQAIKALKTVGLMYVALKDEFLVLSQQEEKKVIKQIPLQFPVSDLQLSAGEELLGVATCGGKGSEGQIMAPNIIIYSIQSNRENPFASTIFSIDQFNETITRIDFSLNTQFIMIQTADEDTVYFDFKLIQKMDQIAEQKDIEWCNEGPASLASQTRNGISNFYSDQNKITIFKQARKHNTAIVADEIGTLRLFNTASQEQLQCYSNHLFAINFCVLSPDERWLITLSKGDHSWIIWAIN